jgi:gliding motility-associated protein GldM
MLALNVSAAIMNGYAQVEESLHSTIEATLESNNDSYATFEQALAKNPEKTQEWYDKAMEVKRISEEFNTYVQNFKDEMIAISEGKNAQPGMKLKDLDKQDDTNVPQQYAIEEGHAEELKQKIHEYRDAMISITGDSRALDEELRMTFQTPRGVNTSEDSISWEESVFHEMPMCACITVLTKLQNDIRHSEGRAVRYLLTQTDAGDLRVNKFNAYVVPSSRTVVQGTKYSANLILAAIDSTKTPVYEVNGRECKNGFYEIVANSVGKHKLSGRIGYMDQQGEMQYLPVDSEYEVIEPTATISNTDLNIMFVGHPNPFSISVPGVSSNQLQVKCEHAEVTNKGNGNWIIIPKSKDLKKITLSVLANVDGSMIPMGSQEFRVRELPRADAYLSVEGELMPEPKLTAGRLANPSNEVVASYGKDGLVEAKFEVESFVVRMPDGTEIEVAGNKLNQKALKAIKGLKAGRIVTITSIKAKTEEGSVQTLRSLYIELR